MSLKKLNNYQVIFNFVEIKDTYNLKYTDSTLFVSIDQSHIHHLTHITKAYYLNEQQSKPLLGLTINDVKQILNIFHYAYYIQKSCIMRSSIF